MRTCNFFRIALWSKERSVAQRERAAGRVRKRFFSMPRFEYLEFIARWDFFPDFSYVKRATFTVGWICVESRHLHFSHQQTRNRASEATHHGLNSPKSTHAASHLRTTFLSESEWSATSWRMNLFFMHQPPLLRIFSRRTWKLLAKPVPLSAHIDARNFYLFNFKQRERAAEEKKEEQVNERASERASEQASERLFLMRPFKRFLTHSASVDWSYLLRRVGDFFFSSRVSLRFKFFPTHIFSPINEWLHSRF